MEKITKKIYLSMPITGYDISERQEYAEKMKNALISAYGDDYEVITPFEINPYNPSQTWEDCMRKCIGPLAECDKAYFCKGWEKSRGCIAEHYIASICGIEMSF